MSCSNIFDSIQASKKCAELNFQKIKMIGIKLPTTLNPFRDIVGGTSTLDQFTTNIDTEATFVAAKDAASPDTFMLSDRIYVIAPEGGEQQVAEFDSLDALKTNGTDTTISITFVVNDLAIDAGTPARGTLSQQSKDNFSVFSDNQTFDFILFGEKDSKTGTYPYYFDYDATNDVADFIKPRLVRISNEITLADGLLQVTAEIRLPYGWTKTLDQAYITTFDPLTVS